MNINMPFVVVDARRPFYEFINNYVLIRSTFELRPEVNLKKFTLFSVLFMCQSYDGSETVWESEKKKEKAREIGDEFYALRNFIIV